MKTKEHGVILLATDKASKNHTLWLNNNKQLLFTKTSKPESLIPQHLYITSDEEIKKGDWYIHKQAGNLRVQQCVGSNLPMDAKKIIATTDTSLKRNMGAPEHKGVKGKPLLWGIPQIPQEWLQYYVEQYNKGNVIEKCGVEYYEETLIREPKEGGGYLYKINKELGLIYGFDNTPSISVALEKGWELVDGIKLNPDNTINIVRTFLASDTMGFVKENMMSHNNIVIPEEDIFTKEIRFDSSLSSGKRKEKMYSEKEAIDNVYNLLAKKLELKEVGKIPNNWEDKHGNRYILTKYGFKQH